MKSRRYLACACCIFLSMLVAVGVLTATQKSPFTALTTNGLAKLSGGAELCTIGSFGSYCKCDIKKCNDIGCTFCGYYLWNGSQWVWQEDGYCQIYTNHPPEDGMKACWETETCSDSCTSGTWTQSLCPADFWSSPGCTGTRLHENFPMLYDFCS